MGFEAVECLVFVVLLISLLLKCEMMQDIVMPFFDSSIFVAAAASWGVSGAKLRGSG